MSGRDRGHLHANELSELPAGLRHRSQDRRLPDSLRPEPTPSVSIVESDLEHPELMPPGAVEHLQRVAGNAATASLLESAGPFDPIPGQGEPLDAGTAARMGASYGTDFSDVRVHRGPAASRSAASLEARAYTIGNDIVAGEGGLDDHTMAHELAHVVQQRNGPVAGHPVGRMTVSDPSDDFERAADSAATSVAGPVGIQREGFLDDIMGDIPGLGGGGLPSLPGLPDIPGLGGGGLPSLPGLPDIPGLGGGGLPSLPSLPGLPDIPGLGGGGLPSLPSLPGIGGLPNIPGLPSLPSIPGLGGGGLPSLPGLPDISGLGGVPGQLGGIVSGVEDEAKKGLSGIMGGLGSVFGGLFG
jgi:hypothetical protein